MPDPRVDMEGRRLGTEFCWLLNDFGINWMLTPMLLKLTISLTKTKMHQLTKT